MSGIDVDDASPAIIYSSGWTALTNTASTQFDDTVHQTTVNGASATINFTGTRIIVYQTVPTGDGTETANTNLDGVLASISRHLHGTTAYYQDVWFDSGPLTNGPHTLILSNGGDNGGTPLILDKFNIEGSPTVPSAPTTSAKLVELVPSATTKVSTSTLTVVSTAVSSTTASLSGTSTSSSSTTSSSTTTTSTSSSTTTAVPTTATRLPNTETVTSVQYFTTAIANASPPQSALQANPSKGNIGIIAGCAVGGLVALLIFILCLYRFRQRRKQAHILLEEGGEKEALSYPRQLARRLTDVTPFNVSSRANLVLNDDESEHSGLARKASDSSAHYQNDSSTTSHQPQMDPSSSHYPISATASPTSPEKGEPSSATLSVYRQELDAGSYRPHYLSGETVGVRSSDIYGPSTHLGLIDTNDVPPSYQSVNQRRASNI